MEYRTNNIAQFGWNSDGTFIGKSYAKTRRKYEIGDPALLRVLERMLEGTTRERGIDIIQSETDVSSEEAGELFDSLIDRELLLPADHRNFTEADQWFDKNWRRALYYHLGTRNMDFADRDVDDPNAVRREVGATYAETEEAPPVFESYDDQQLHELPDPEPLPNKPLNEVLMARSTNRAFKSNEMSLQDVSTVLYHTFDPVREAREYVAENAESDPLVHTTHSMHLPFDVHLIVARCQDLSPGIYKYSIRDHALAPVHTDFEDPTTADEAVTETIIGQKWNHGSAFTVYFVARIDRYRWRYRHPRAFRTLFMDIPTHAHRLILAATAMDYENFLTPALRNETVDGHLDVDGFNEAAIYTVTIGE